MNTSTSPYKKVFRFCVENDAAIATLEGALAIIRRLGIDLCSLRTSAGEQGMEVQVRLAAAEEEPLVLCRMRLHNVVGILGIREMPALVVPAAARQLVQKTQACSLYTSATQSPHAHPAAISTDRFPLPA